MCALSMNDFLGHVMFVMNIFLKPYQMLYVQMDVWSVAIGNGCWSFSSFNSDDLCVSFDWTGIAKEIFADSFPNFFET